MTDATPGDRNPEHERTHCIDQRTSGKDERRSCPCVEQVVDLPGCEANDQEDRYTNPGVCRDDMNRPQITTNRFRDDASERPDDRVR